jgi:hypothetical protein
MHDEYPSKLKIVTSMAKAIEIHPLTHYNSYSQKGNDFLHGSELSFQDPAFNKATFRLSGYAPKKEWFVLFDEAEKEVMEDAYAFYGICYDTTVELALKRINKVIEKAQEALAGKTEFDSNDKEGWNTRAAFYNRDNLIEVKKALGVFNTVDKITLTFIFSEWPDIEAAKRKEYIKEFEAKLLKHMSRTDNLPF